MEIESSKQFWSEFSPRLLAMRVKLTVLNQDGPQGSNAPRALELWDLKQEYSSLQKFYTESTGVLPMYDIRRAQEELEALSKEVKSLEEVVVPRKKFRFSDKARATITSTGDQAARGVSLGLSSTATTSSGDNQEPSGAEAVQELPKKPRVPQGTVIISGRTNETINLYDADFSRSDFNGQLLVQNCTSCIINVFAVAGSIRLEDLVSCAVLLGPCRTSVYLDTCNECTFLVASHQLRIHKTYKSKLFVRVRTHPIIEDSSGLSFGPYILKYAGIETQFNTAGLSDAHCWDNVVDFRWHRMSQSPNWSIIPETDRRIDDAVLNPTMNNSSNTSSFFKWEYIGAASVASAPLPTSTQTQQSIDMDCAGDSEEDEI